MSYKINETGLDRKLIKRSMWSQGGPGIDPVSYEVWIFERPDGVIVVTTDEANYENMIRHLERRP